MNKSNKIIKKLLNQVDELEQQLLKELKPDRDEVEVTPDTWRDSIITDDELVDLFQSLADLHLLRSDF